MASVWSTFTPFLPPVNVLLNSRESNVTARAEDGRFHEANQPTGLTELGETRCSPEGYCLAVSSRRESRDAIWCSNSIDGPRHGYMTSSSERNTLPPEKFEIVVRGRVSPTLLEAMDGFQASYDTDGLTHLVGVIPDQAGIHSLFQLLLDLNIDLVSVNPVGD